jgi:hypothetical protein
MLGSGGCSGSTPHACAHASKNVSATSGRKEASQLRPNGALVDSQVRKPLDLGTESFTLAPFPTKPQRAAAFRAIAPLNQKKGSERFSK